MDRKGNVFRLAKQLVSKNRDVVSACHVKTEHVIFVVKFKKSAKMLSSRVLHAPGTSLYNLVQSTFGRYNPGLSNLISFLRPALPMALTTDENARGD